jgi:hypothetical protein
VGIAANKPTLGLSILSQEFNDKSPQWMAIEDILLGRKRSRPEKRGTDYMCADSFESYCRFAGAVRAMQQKNFALAVKEFNQIKQHDSCNTHLPVYAAALKDYCLKKH